MRFRSLLVVAALAVLTFAFVACCGDDGDDCGTTGGEGGQAILNKTHINFRSEPFTGELLPGSSIGDSPFCPGATFRDGDADGPWLVEKTLDCPDGTLRVGFSPEGVGHKQTGPWEVLGGTGAFEGLRGKGEMEVTGKAGEGRETFTGTVEP